MTSTTGAGDFKGVSYYREAPIADIVLSPLLTRGLAALQISHTQGPITVARALQHIHTIEQRALHDAAAASQNDNASTYGFPSEYLAQTLAAHLWLQQWILPLQTSLQQYGWLSYPVLLREPHTETLICLKGASRLLAWLNLTGTGTAPAIVLPQPPHSSTWLELKWRAQFNMQGATPTDLIFYMLRMCYVTYGDSATPKEIKAAAGACARLTGYRLVTDLIPVVEALLAAPHAWAELLMRMSPRLSLWQRFARSPSLFIETIASHPDVIVRATDRIYTRPIHISPPATDASSASATSPVENYIIPLLRLLRAHNLAHWLRHPQHVIWRYLLVLHQHIDDWLNAWRDIQAHR